MASPNPTIAQMRSQLLQQKAAGSDIAQAGATHVTKQEGPFFRVTPKSLVQGEVSTRGVREATEPQHQGAVPGATGPTARRVPKSFSNEEIASLIKDPGNPALQIAKQHTQEAHGKEFSTADISPSSLQKQSAIATTHMAAVDGSPEYKQAIFDAYAQQMPEVVSAVGAKGYDDLLEKSYRQLAKETADQFNKMPVSMSFHRNGEGNYNGAKEMAGDVLGNRHLYVFQGGDKHDFLHHVDKHTGLNENEKFRAVHDFFGHAIHGNEFGPAGEEKAWNIHRQMYSPLAQLAMTAETRGQNSVVNYSPLNAELKSEVAKLRELQIEAKRRGDTQGYAMATKAIKDAFNGFQYAPQKAILLPPEFTKPEYEGGMPDYVQKLIKPKAGTEISSALTHFSNRPDLEYADPSKYGTGIKGAEAERLNEYPGAVRDRSYFYMGEPGEVTPEPGLGAHRYRGESSSLYDITQDPLKFRMLAREANRVPYTAKYNQGMTYPLQEANDLERLVREHGYQGMANPKASKPMAIMFNQTPVQRQAKGGSVDPSMDAMKLALTKHGMYSPLEKAAMGVNRTKGTPAEFMAEISKQPGFRKEEVADRRLQLPDQKLTKPEFMAHLKKSPVPNVTENVLHDFGDEEDALQAASQAIYGQDYDEVYDDRKAREKVEAWVKDNSAKYQDYQLPGGKNYREMLLQTPHFGEADEHRMMELEADKRRSPYPEHWGVGSSLARELRELKERKANMGDQYHSSHWQGHPNVIAHMRLSDRKSPEGKKLLHIEEIQSDWHQEGRKKGYVDPKERQHIVDKLARNEELTPAEEEARLRHLGGKSVPDAPFKKNWHELAIKHALHHAAKNGYHGVVITPGQEQADRYKLSKHIDAIGYNPKSNMLEAYDKERKQVLNKAVPPEELESHIGKEAAKKLLESEPVMGKHLLEGAGLDVGGEGMKGFYDKIVPDYLNKLGKPHGVKVETINPGILADKPKFNPDTGKDVYAEIPLHHFPITEPMRQQILQGQPMYKQGGIIHKAEGGVVQPSIAQMRMAINQVKNPIDIQGIGANEAPNMSPKLYLPPVKDEGRYPAPGGVATPSGMPIGGIDQSQQQPGQQLMPGQPQQGPQGGLPGQPPQGGAPGAPAGPTGPTPPMGNMLSMTPQGQAMQAMGGAPSGPPGAPTQPAPTGMAMGGEVQNYADGSRVTKRNQTVKNAQRMAYPGVYGRPDEIAALAASRVAPEDPILKQLFGVSRAEMYEQAGGRQGMEHLGMLPGGSANPRGAESAENIMNKRNEQRLIDVMAEAKKHQGLVHGMEPWYYMDPLFKHMVRLLGIEKATEEYKKMNALMGMSSSASEVNTEIPRGSLAYYLQNQGRFGEFVEHGGKRDPNRPADFGETPGHLAHKTAHAVPMQKFLERGEVDMSSPKVPLYIEASGVPETGFQTRTPVGDAHWSRAVGLADTRNPKTVKGQEMVPGQSVTNPEMSVLGPWWRKKVAAKLGLESVPAQALAWGAFSPQTGVTTPIGAPKLELIAKQIRHTANRLGVSPETARDMVLTGKERMGKKSGGKVKLAQTQDTMRLALTKKKAK